MTVNPLPRGFAANSQGDYIVMKTIIVPRNRGFAVLDGKHNLGGPLDIPAGAGQYGEIFFDVAVGDDMGFLSCNYELSPKGSEANLHVELFNVGGTSLGAAPDYELVSQGMIIPFDTDTKSNTVKKLSPGRYSYRVSDKNGAAHTGLVFSLLQTIPH